ncbi:MAG: hypothetical protein LR001_03230 [Clostridiales bacterium]|nr:hypothetical protein [Clostridiales bacterium]
MIIENAAKKIKSIYRWFADEESVFAEICGVFALITFANSYMMVSGMDTPKVGRFAYTHLLIRLKIIFIFFLIWDYKAILSEIKRHMKKLKGLPNIKFKNIYKNVLKNRFNSICITYTSTIVIFCIIMIFRVCEPRGGAGLYFNLILLFTFITITILLLYILERIKASLQGNQKL